MILKYKHKELIYSFPLNILILTNTSINFGNFELALTANNLKQSSNQLKILLQLYYFFLESFLAQLLKM